MASMGAACPSVENRQVGRIVTSRTAASRKPRRNRKIKRRSRFEQLETRQLLAVDLTLSFADSAIPESGGSSVLTIVRSGDLSGATLIELLNDDPGEASIVSSVLIPPNETSITTTLTGVSDGEIDGTQTVTISAATNGALAGSASIDILDSDQASISIQVIPDHWSFQFDSSPNGFIGQRLTDYEISDLDGWTIDASRNFDNGVSFAMNNPDPNRDLTSTDWYLEFAAQDEETIVPGSYPGALKFPNSDSNALNVFGNGRANNQSAGFFDVQLAEYDSEGTVERFQASFTQFDEGFFDRSITGSIDYRRVPDKTIRESDGAGARMLLISRNDITVNAGFFIELVSSDPSEASVPEMVFISEDVTQILVPIDAVDDNLLDGTQTVTITAHATGYLSDSDTFQVTDDELLEISFDNDEVSEANGSTTATLTRADATSELTVSLSVNDESELAVDATVTFPVGINSLSIPLEVLNDDVVDGPQPVNLTATAAGFAGVSDSIVVLDDDVIRDPAVTWETPDPIAFGTRLSAEQLNASSPVAGSFTYTPDINTLLEVGDAQTLMAVFTPEDTATFNTITVSVTLDVVKAIPEITWRSPNPIVAGTPITEAQLNARADVEGSFEYSPPAGTILSAGLAQNLLVNFTPADQDHFQSTSATVRIDVLAIEYDFGDAPESFPVTLQQDGARHLIGDRFLGSSIDAENDGQPSVDAASDQSDDGITFNSSLLSAETDTTTASFQTVASASGKLDAWIDFNQDGDWDDTDEHVLASFDVASGENLISLDVPAGMPTGSAAARFRFSSAGGLTPSGLADDGEVEDHVLPILASTDHPTVSTNLINQFALLRLEQDDLTLRTLGQDPFVGGEVFFAGAAGSIGTLGINGSPDNDAITVDSSDNDTLPAGGIVIDGGAGSDQVLVMGNRLDFAADGPFRLRNISQIDSRHATATTLRLDAVGFAELGLGTGRLLVNAGLEDSFQFADAGDWRMSETRFANNGFIRTITNQIDSDLSIDLDRERPWQNVVQASDVNNNGEVSSADALRIINELGRNEFSDPLTQQLSHPLAVSSWPGVYFDQNADDRVTALDALRVINELTLTNLTTTAEAESLGLDQDPTRDVSPVDPPSPTDIGGLPTRIASFDLPTHGEQESMIQYSPEAIDVIMSLGELDDFDLGELG